MKYVHTYVWCTYKHTYAYKYHIWIMTMVYNRDQSNILLPFKINNMYIRTYIIQEILINPFLTRYTHELQGSAYLVSWYYSPCLWCWYECLLVCSPLTLVVTTFYYLYVYGTCQLPLILGLGIALIINKVH